MEFLISNIVLFNLDFQKRFTSEELLAELLIRFILGTAVQQFNSIFLYYLSTVNVMFFKSKMPILTNLNTTKMTTYFHWSLIVIHLEVRYNEQYF